ncbi:23715_t:CDS:1, partial [Racocetra persica]
MQFQKQTNKKLKKHISYSSEYEIFDILKEEISLIYAIYKKIKADQKDLFVYYLKGRMSSFKEEIIEENY